MYELWPHLNLPERQIRSVKISQMKFDNLIYQKEKEKDRPPNIALSISFYLLFIGIHASCVWW